MISRRDKDATRSERKAKRKAMEDRIPDLPGDTDANDKVQDPAEKPAEKKRSRNKIEEDGISVENRATKRARKFRDQDQSECADKKHDQQSSTDAPDGGIAIQSTEQNGGKLRKTKKERKAERKALQAAAEHQVEAEKSSKKKLRKVDTDGPSERVPMLVAKSVKKDQGKREESDAGGEVGGGGTSSKAPRFIVFVGNLPFTATKASIQEHFAKVKPKDVRNLTEKNDPSKSRGIAFVEFDGYDRMKTCLKLMHHSEFNDGKSAPRKINVELTAGGGGKTKQRTTKIKVKNHKLQEQRLRRIQEEGKAKTEKGSFNVGDVHPSRLGRLGLE